MVKCFKLGEEIKKLLLKILSLLKFLYRIYA